MAESIPRFLHAANIPQPGYPEEHQWVVHCHPPMFKARVDIRTDGGLELIPLFEQAQETIDPAVLQEVLEAGAQYFADVVRRAHEAQNRSGT
jgi:hypothetical protein